MIASELARTIKGCAGPTIVCAQAGNINTGAFDPLPEISAASREAGAWLHVDGAFGLWAAVSDQLKHLTAGAELADSWATDAHKWLNVPYDCGLIMCAHPEPHRAAMNVSASTWCPPTHSAIHVNGCPSCREEEEASLFTRYSSTWAAAAFAT
jgi:Glutamate decarboxylase and related PLP-dependent proteins